MPWSVAKGHGCPEDKPYAVVKDSSGKKVACHKSPDAARQQVKALYANEKSGEYAELLKRLGGGSPC